MTARRCRASLAFCLALALGGCATRVPQVLPASLEPKSFSGTADNAQESWPTPGWWQSFGSPELSALIERAQLNNQDIAVAAARMREAHAQVVIQRSALFPQLNARGDAQRSNEPSSVYSGNQFELDNNVFSLNLEGTYALDLWGLARSNLRAAGETLKAARFGEQAVRLNLTARVANSYFSVLALRERIAITKGDIEAINALFDVIKLKVAAGKLSHLELAQEQAQLAVEQAQLPILEQQELESRVTLAVLVGEAPEDFGIDAAEAAAVSPPAVSPGLPSRLLLRRPDVAQAEANLASAHANLDAARAAFLPQFSLTGAAGYASGAIHALISGPSFIWSAAASASQTIFAGGRLVGEKRLALATQERLTANYRNAVLNAFADVEQALGQVRNYSLAEDYFRRAVTSAKEAFEVSQLQYRQGTADLIIVLQTQQTLFGAKDQLVQVRLARIQGLIHLYQALGGGWVEPESDRTQLLGDVR